MDSTKNKGREIFNCALPIVEKGNYFKTLIAVICEDNDPDNPYAMKFYRAISFSWGTLKLHFLFV